MCLWGFSLCCAGQFFDSVASVCCVSVVCVLRYDELTLCDVLKQFSSSNVHMHYLIENIRTVQIVITI